MYWRSAVVLLSLLDCEVGLSVAHVVDKCLRPWSWSGCLPDAIRCMERQGQCNSRQWSPDACVGPLMRFGWNIHLLMPLGWMIQAPGISETRARIHICAAICQICSSVERHHSGGCCWMSMGWSLGLLLGSEACWGVYCFHTLRCRWFLFP